MEAITKDMNINEDDNVSWLVRKIVQFNVRTSRDVISANRMQHF